MSKVDDLSGNKKKSCISCSFHDQYVHLVKIKMIKILPIKKKTSTLKSDETTRVFHCKKPLQNNLKPEQARESSSCTDQTKS